MTYSHVMSYDRPYRSRRGIVFGVCRGLAEYFNISVFWTRVLVLLALLFTGFWPVGVVYILAALLLKKEPYCPLEWRAAAEYCEPKAGEGLRERLRRRCDSIERRLQRMENRVTSPSYDWDRRLNEGL